MLCLEVSVSGANFYRKTHIWFFVACSAFVSVKVGVEKISKFIESVGKTINLWKKEDIVVRKRWITDRLTGSLNDRQPFLVSTSSNILFFAVFGNYNTVLFQIHCELNNEFMVEQGAYAVYGQSSSLKCYLSHIWSYGFCF